MPPFRRWIVLCSKHVCPDARASAVNQCVLQSTPCLRAYSTPNIRPATASTQRGAKVGDDTLFATSHASKSLNGARNTSKHYERTVSRSHRDPAEDSSALSSTGDEALAPAAQSLAEHPVAQDTPANHDDAPSLRAPRFSRDYDAFDLRLAVLQPSSAVDLATLNDQKLPLAQRLTILANNKNCPIREKLSLFRALLDQHLRDPQAAASIWDPPLDAVLGRFLLLHGAAPTALALLARLGRLGAGSPAPRVYASALGSALRDCNAAALSEFARALRGRWTPEIEHVAFAEPALRALETWTVHKDRNRRRALRLLLTGAPEGRPPSVARLFARLLDGSAAARVGPKRARWFAQCLVRLGGPDALWSAWRYRPIQKPWRRRQDDSEEQLRARCGAALAVADELMKNDGRDRAWGILHPWVKHELHVDEAQGAPRRVLAHLVDAMVYYGSHDRAWRLVNHRGLPVHALELATRGQLALSAPKRLAPNHPHLGSWNRAMMEAAMRALLHAETHLGVRWTGGEDGVHVPVEEGSGREEMWLRFVAGGKKLGDDGARNGTDEGAAAPRIRFLSTLLGAPMIDEAT